MTQSRIPSLNWLRVFEAAAREENFARAAEKLNMSAPAVSQQIKALENHLGRSLFQRLPQKVRLTPAGAAFLPVVQQSLASVETTAAALFGSKIQTTITLQAVTLLAASWLPKHLAAFEAAHPRLRVNVITAETQSTGTKFLRSSPEKPSSERIGALSMIRSSVSPTKVYATFNGV